MSYYIGDAILLNTQPTGCAIIPISMVYEFKEANSFYGASSVFYANPKLQALDILERKLSGQLRFNPGGMLFVSKESNARRSLNYKQTSKNPFTVITLDKLNPAQQVMNIEGSEKVAESILAYIDVERLKIFQQCGISEIALGQTNSLQSGAAVGNVLQQSHLMDKSTLPHIENYVHRNATIIIDYLKTYYNKKTEETTLRVDEKDPMKQGKTPYRFIKIKKDTFKNIEVDIIAKITLSPHITQQANVGILTEILRMQSQSKKTIIPDEVLINELLPHLASSQYIKQHLGRVKVGEIQAIMRQEFQKFAGLLDGESQGVEQDTDLDTLANEAGTNIFNQISGQGPLGPGQAPLGQEQGLSAQEEQLPIQPGQEQGPGLGITQ